MRIDISGSSPDISNNAKISFYNAREAQLGRAELWRCLGYKFKSYVERFMHMFKICSYYIVKGSDGIGRHK